MIYKVVMCPKCGHIQVTYARKVFRCFRCKKYSKLDEKIKVFKVTTDPRLASAYCRALKGLNKTVGFATYKITQSEEDNVE